MKKILLIITVLSLAILANGQTMMPRGMKVGEIVSGTNIVTIDSISQLGTDGIRFYKGATQLYPYITTDFVTDLQDSLDLKLYKADLRDSINSIGGVSEVKLRSGIVTARNIDVTHTGYVPDSLDMIKILTNSSIASGDTITLSINGGDELNIFGYTEHDESYAITVIYMVDRWYIYRGEVEGLFDIGYGTPASASATGATGQMKFDSDYIYICIATNTWKRIAISTW